MMKSIRQVAGKGDRCVHLAGVLFSSCPKSRLLGGLIRWSEVDSQLSIGLTLNTPCGELLHGRFFCKAMIVLYGMKSKTSFLGLSGIPKINGTIRH